jgi:AAA+ ATPase superfamily predicted ATPase
MPFIDRVTELQFLKIKWLSGKAELLVLWGKRRVGKTELVKQFIQGKPSIYFMAESTGEKEQLHRFSKAIARLGTYLIFSVFQKGKSEKGCSVTESC